MASDNTEMYSLLRPPPHHDIARAYSRESLFEEPEPAALSATSIPGQSHPQSPEINTKNNRKRVQIPKSDSVAARLGKTAITVLSSSFLVIAAVLGFLSFLWFGTSSDKTWHAIAYRGWMSRAITLSTLSLRSAISAQAVVLTSMLAGLILEKHQALGSELAALCQMRGTNSGPRELSSISTKTIFKSGIELRAIHLPLLTILLLAVSLVVQISSTLLLSDLGQAAIIRPSVDLSIQTSFSYGVLSYGIPTTQAFVPPRFRRSSAWLHTPIFFPTFAEYTEAPVEGGDAVLDTGTLLRAFLPLESEGARNKIQNYVGQATVVDSRVVCTRPDILRPQVFWDNPDPAFVGAHYVRIEGQTAVSSTFDGYQSNNTVNRTKPYVIESTAFNCFSQPYDGEKQYWQLSICQADQPGGLMSAFGQMGPAYLVLNITRGDWSLVLGANGTHVGTEPRNMTARGIWQDLNFVDPAKTADTSAKWQLSLSLCFTAFDSADLKIEAHSEINRTEPVRSFNHNIRRPDYRNTLSQLGYNADGSRSRDRHVQRGILQLEKAANWNPREAVGSNARPLVNSTIDRTKVPYWPILSPLVNSAKFEGPGSPLVSASSNYTGFLHMTTAAGRVLNQAYNSSTWNETTGKAIGPKPAAFIIPDASYSLLAQQIVQRGGSIPDMLSSLFTVLAGATYYDQMDEFDLNTTTQQAVFVSNLVPLRYTGYTAVVSIVIAHIVIAVAIIMLFMLQTSISTIGNSWQNAAQLIDPSTERLLRAGQLVRDKEVKRIMKRTETGLEQTGSPAYEGPSTGLSVIPMLKAKERVGIGLNPDGTGTQIVFRRQKASGGASE